MNSSLTRPLNISQRITEIEGLKKLSLYEDNYLDSKTWLEGIAMIKKAFPRLENDWFDLVAERVKALKFTNKRFLEAVTKLCDENKYPNPAPAEIIRFDKQVNLLTHDQVAKEGKTFGDSVWAFYEIVDIEGKPYYVLRRDIEVNKLELKKWELKKPEQKTNVTGYYKDGIKQIKKTFSLVDDWNKVVKETGIGEEIERGKI